MDLARSFGNLSAPVEKESTPPVSDAKAAAPKKKPEKHRAGQPVASTRGKSSNPHYEAVKVLVKTDYRDQATSKWQKEHGRKRDFSDLVEHLLAEYIGA